MELNNSLTSEMSVQHLLWLTVAAFAIGTEGFMIAGILPAIANDLDVSVATAGHLVTAFSLAYAVAAPACAVALSGVERKRLLGLTLLAFATANLLAAAASSFAALLGARILLGITAATLMPAASAAAIELSRPEMRGRALSIVYAGMTIAILVGVPIGAAAGASYSWRAAFVGVAALAAQAAAGIAFSIPRLAPPAVAGIAERLAVARRPEVLGVLALTVAVMAGAFSVYTYLAPLFRGPLGMSAESTVAAFLLFGATGALGNLLGGYAADKWNLTASLKVAIGTVMAVFATLALAGYGVFGRFGAPIAVASVAIWGIFGWSIPTMQQARLVSLAPHLASISLSLQASAIYLGICTGAALGSAAIALSSVAAVGFAGATCEVVALLMLALEARRMRPARAS
jgi:predicted MFS family arabinose efflux permease